jgi:hypothetical protein
LTSPRTKVVFTDPLIPAEWVAAHGFLPSRAAPASPAGGQDLPGLCPFARAFVASTDASAVVFTTCCDQMRRIPDLAPGPPTYLFHVPHTTSAGAEALYLDELRRLGRFLVGLGGCEPSSERLEAEVAHAEGMRKGLLDAGLGLGAAQWARLLLEAHETYSLPAVPEPNLAQREGIPVAFVAGHLTREYVAIYDLIESLGGRLVLDGTGLGPRTFPAKVAPDLLRADPLQAIALAHFSTVPDPFRRPNDAFFRWVEENVRESGARGIVLHRYLWCDTWHAEAPRIAERAGLPVLELDSADGAGPSPRHRNRLESFLETLV